MDDFYRPHTIRFPHQDESLPFHLVLIKFQQACHSSSQRASQHICAKPLPCQLKEEKQDKMLKIPKLTAIHLSQGYKA